MERYGLSGGDALEVFTLSKNAINGLKERENLNAAQQIGSVDYD